MTNSLVGSLSKILREPPRAHRFRVARWMGRNLARLTWGFLVEPTWLEVNHVTVCSPHLPADHPKLRIVHLTDFHLQRRMPRDYLWRSIARAMALRGDLIALTGDFVHGGPKQLGLMQELLRHLKAPLGVYAVLGNHDFSVRNALGIRHRPRLHRKVVRALEASGVQVLQNRAVTVESAGARWAVVGVDDLWSGQCRLSQALADVGEGVPRVILAHNPRTIEQMESQRCDLMLSGHTHGGQVHLPGIGTPMLGPKMRRFEAGLYRVGDAQVYVNKGIGYSVRFRYNRRPEVAVLHVSGGSAEPAASRGIGISTPVQSP